MADCKYFDPTCPCQDGDQCHYETYGGSLGIDPRYVLLAHIAELTAETEWQPIETAPKMRKIIVTYVNEARKRRTVMACYYEDHALEMSGDYAEVGVWDEASGESYAPAGWYEEVDHDGDIFSLGGEPDFWRPLPAPPERTQELE